MKINIAQVIFSAAMGGAESVVQQIITHLDAEKFNCFLITDDEVKSEFEGVYRNIFSIGRHYELFDFSLANRIFEYINQYFPIQRKLLDFKIGKIARFLLEKKVAIAHSHLAWDHYALSKIRNDGIKKIMTIHGSFGLDTGIPTPIGPKEIVGIVNNAHCITSACGYFLKLLKDNGLRPSIKCEVIENGISRGTIEGKKESVISDGRLKMTFMGGDKFNKGADILIKALDIVVNKHGYNKVHVDVLRDVGINSEMREMVRKYHIENCVTFVGYVSDNDHLRFISRNELFVLCSRSEGVANTLMEAIGLDKPILATDVGGTGEVVIHNRNGYLCQPTPESLAEGIMFYINNPSKLKEYSEANRNIKSRFYWDNVVEKYEKLYKKLVK